MLSRPSPHFIPVSLSAAFNRDRSYLDAGLGPQAGSGPDWSTDEGFGDHVFHGIPFELGHRGQPNVVVLDPTDSAGSQYVTVELQPTQASYFVFLHVVEDADHGEPFESTPSDLTGIADRIEGNALGTHVADYILIFDDDSQVAVPVHRRFAIQQRHISWGASPFAAVPFMGPNVFTTATEDYLLDRSATRSWGVSETRHDSMRHVGQENLWLYALPNPFPGRAVKALVLQPKEERCAVYAITATLLKDHPLRPGVRRKARVTLPDMLDLNALQELDADSRGASITIDLGTVISARASLNYDADAWSSDVPDVQPTQSKNEVVVEYAAHPAAKLYVGTDLDDTWVVDLSDHEISETSVGIPSISPIASAHQAVQVQVIDKDTRQIVPVRLHVHGEHGEYLPPRGHHRKVNPYWFEDNSAEFVNGLNQYAYIDGECVIDLPVGTVGIEISRGYEFTPIRTIVDITPGTTELTFEIQRRLPWRERGWITADTHVHFLSPQVALLEGSAEGINVVNLLASQWGEMYSNVGDFDGRTTFGATDLGGNGEFAVRVGTENRMQVLGHISLLGYSGHMIHPLSSGGPAESAIGDPLEVTLAEWAAQCRQQGGMVIMPHAPNPQAERAATITSGLVDGIELKTFNPFDAQLNPYGLADWYRYLSLGFQVPIVGGSDKMSAASLLGGIRTYAHLGDQRFTYESWMDAVRSGNTFVTVGPLVDFLVAGKPAGSQINMPDGGGTLDVTWTVESVSVPIDQVEVLVNGLVYERVNAAKRLAAVGQTRVRVTESSWIALRVRGSYRGRHGEIAAHTSAVQVIVGGRRMLVSTDATAVLEQIEGAIAYVDTLAPRPDAMRYKQLRASLESAYARLHQRLHHASVFHQHSPIHRHDAPHEH